MRGILTSILAILLVTCAANGQVGRVNSCARSERVGNLEIHEAANLGKTDVVRNLTKRNPSEVNARNATGWTPLHCAVAAGRDPVVDVLLRGGAKPDIGDSDGATPLHIAAGPVAAGASIDAYRRVLELLIESGADLQARDKNGATPLHWAAQKGDVVAVQVLLRNKAPVDARDSRGLIAIQSAQAQGRTDVIAIFRQFAVTPPPMGAAGTVRGRVLWNEEPLAGARITVTSEYNFSSTQYGRAETDSLGRFSISGVPEGKKYLYVFGNQPAFWVSAVTPFEMKSGLDVTAPDTYVCKGFDPVSPAKDESLKTNRPLLSWNPYPNAVDYAVRVIRKGAGTFDFSRGDRDPRIRGMNVAVDRDLPPGEYDWRVDAFNAAGHLVGCSYYPRSFKITPVDGNLNPTSDPTSNVFPTRPDTLPQAIYSPNPDYTDVGRQKKITGDVALRVVVDANGNVDSVSVLRSLESTLDESAVRTVRTWKFQPARRGGQPVQSEITVEVTFRLQ